MFPVAALTGIADSAHQLAEFKRRTADKLNGLRCPVHQRPPRIMFRGDSLREVSIQMSGCCEALLSLANRRIADPLAGKTRQPEHAGSGR